MLCFPNHVFLDLTRLACHSPTALPRPPLPPRSALPALQFPAYASLPNFPRPNQALPRPAISDLACTSETWHSLSAPRLYHPRLPFHARPYPAMPHRDVPAPAGNSQFRPGRAPPRPSIASLHFLTYASLAKPDCARPFPSFLALCSRLCFSTGLGDPLVQTLFRRAHRVEHFHEFF